MFDGDVEGGLEAGLVPTGYKGLCEGGFKLGGKADHLSLCFRAVLKKKKLFKRLDATFP